MPRKLKVKCEHKHKSYETYNDGRQCKEELIQEMLNARASAEYHQCQGLIHDNMVLSGQETGLQVFLGGFICRICNASKGCKWGVLEYCVTKCRIFTAFPFCFATVRIVNLFFTAKNTMYFTKIRRYLIDLIK